MSKISKRLTKQNISKKINNVLGFSNTYSLILTNDLIDILREMIKAKSLNIKNFGSFKILKKKERVGRNPKTGKNFIISARRSISFTQSKKTLS